MLTSRFLISAALAGFLVVGVLTTSQPVVHSDEPSGDPGVQELTRGPVHEAFEKPVVFDPKPGLMVEKEPPTKLIDEVAPDEKPEGENIEWITGYWGWDPARTDYIWISGFWREIPVGKQWVAGYWNRANGGWQWISGYWGPTDTSGVDYLPEPPASMEVGPSVPSPGDDYIYSPGCWMWYETRYQWRPGYWIHNHPGWVWVPSHYVWTPSGCIYIAGYWDYSPRRRGMLFAPVYFDSVVYHRPHFRYRPRLVIDVDVFTDHCFYYPSYNHCVFGDYYDHSFVSIGISPWFSFHYGRTAYSPIYHYHHCHYRRHDPHWHVRMHSNHEHRRNHRNSRPASTYIAQQNNITINNVTVNNNNSNNKTVNKNSNNTQLALASPLSEVSKSNKVKLVKVDQTKQLEIQENVKSERQFRTKRSQVETESAAKGVLKQPKDNAKPMKLDFQKSPIASKKTDQTVSPRGAKLPELPKAEIRSNRGNAKLGENSTDLPQQTLRKNRNVELKTKEFSTSEPKLPTNGKKSFDLKRNDSLPLPKNDSSKQFRKFNTEPKRIEAPRNSNNSSKKNESSQKKNKNKDD